MNPNLLPLSLVAAVGLLVAPQTSEATIYTFVVDLPSGIGIGFFTIDLPDSWPGNIGHSTPIPASLFRGFYTRGDKWTSLSVTLNEPQPGTFEEPDNAELSGASRKVAAFKCPTQGLGLTPVEAVANLPGVTLLPIGVTQSEISRQRRSRLLETNILLRAGRYPSRQKPRLTSGTFSTDRVVDPASLVLLESVSAGRISSGEIVRRPRRQNAVPGG